MNHPAVLMLWQQIRLFFFYFEERKKKRESYLAFIIGTKTAFLGPLVQQNDQILYFLAWQQPEKNCGFSFWHLNDQIWVCFVLNSNTTHLPFIFLAWNWKDLYLPARKIDRTALWGYNYNIYITVNVKLAANQRKNYNFGL